MKLSVVIRTLNEAHHLPELLDGIFQQILDEGDSVEVVLVDSGSEDETLKIAQDFGCNIVHIRKEEFSFGRSLNMGCEHADGEMLIFVSGHCVPENRYWLRSLVAPIKASLAVYTYGKQIGNGVSKFSEKQLFKKYFPDTSAIPQKGFFCNNANSALLKDIWENNPFDEELTGLEDMELSKRLVAKNLRIAYVAEASVFHLHEEDWMTVKRRYEREAIALQKIMPEVHVSFTDFLRYFISSVLLDMGVAIQEKCFLEVVGEVFIFRLMQYWGAYAGNQEHRSLSREMKEKYFYPS